MTFPLEFPAAAFRCRANGLAFDLDPNNDAEISSPTWGGLVQSIGQGRRLWRMRYDLVTLREADAESVISAIRRLRGTTRRFRAINPLRRVAQAYPNGYAGLVRAGGGAFDGTATLYSIGEALDTVTLSGLSGGFVLTPGDFMSWAYGGTRQALHAVVVGGVANSSGIVSVTLEPTIIPGVETGATVELLNPWCKASLVKGSVRDARLVNRRRDISYVAIQDIRP